MNTESLIRLLSLISVLTGIPAIVMVGMTLSLALTDPPRLLKKVVIDIAHEEMPSTVAKKKSVISQVPIEVQSQLDRLLAVMEKADCSGWDTA